MHTYSGLTSLLESEVNERRTTGFTGVEVYFLPRLQAYLKIGQLGRGTDLKREAEVLRWMEVRARVPRLIGYAANGRYEALMITACRGEPLSNIFAAAKDSSTAESLIRMAAEELADLHKLSIDECPFKTRLNWRLDRGKVNAERGCLSETDEEFAAEHGGKLPLDVWRELSTVLPAKEELVFTHGDPSLPNLIWNGPDNISFIDLDGAGVADRYVDIAIMLRSIRYNLKVDAAIEVSFMDGYGLIELNRQKLDYYTLIDDLF
jgi:aminoglycoside phosphotransferase